MAAPHSLTCFPPSRGHYLCGGRKCVSSYLRHFQDSGKCLAHSTCSVSRRRHPPAPSSWLSWEARRGATSCCFSLFLLSGSPGLQVFSLGSLWKWGWMYVSSVKLTNDETSQVFRIWMVRGALPGPSHQACKSFSRRSLQWWLSAGARSKRSVVLAVV